MKPERQDVSVAERYHGSRYSVYNQGSTVFQPERKTEHERRAEERKYVSDAKEEIRKRAVRKNKEQRFHSVGRILFVSVALLAAVFLFYNYIECISERASLKREITALEKQQESLRRENILLTNEFENKIDYQAVYDDATKRLGMTMPEKRQILYYSRSVTEYVVRSTRIPRE